MGAYSPKCDGRLVDNKAMGIGRFKARSRSHSTIDIRRQAALSAGDMVMIVPHARLVFSRVTRQLKSPDKPIFHQNI